MTFEDDIRKQAAVNVQPVSGQKSLPPLVNKDGGQLIMDACDKAAAMVRSVHEMHKAEGETLAQHLEQIGETFMKLCKEAARQVRDVRIMPQEMAESTANDLAELGKREYERFRKVTAGLVEARDALNAIDQAAEIKPNGPVRRRPT